MRDALDDEERRLRVELLTMQIDKIRYDQDAERRRGRREVIQIALAVAALVIAAFAAGHFIP